MNFSKDNIGLSVGISGMGAVTPLGGTVEEFWEAVKKGHWQFDRIDLFDTRAHRTSVAAEIKKPAELQGIRNDVRLLSRADRFAFTAVRECLQDSGIFDEATGTVCDPDRIGLVVGTAAGSILGLETFFRLRHERQPVPHPSKLLNSFCLSATATNLALEFDIRGPRMTVTTVCSSSGLALAAGMELLRDSDLTRVLVVGTETLSEVTHAGFNILRSVDPDSCRPFDESRRGLVLGEGAGAILLEREPREGLPFRACLSGYGLTTDLHHFTAPQPEGLGVEKTMRLAIQDAGLSGEIGYINAHGTGTRLNDVAESRGIRQALGKGWQETAVSSTKSMIGHTLGAASILEAIVTVRSLEEGLFPPTAHLQHPDTACDLLHVARQPRRGKLETALSNSFAFGGSNITLVFRKTGGAPFRAGTIVEKPALPVITGMGIVSPLGCRLESFSAAVGSGCTGVTALDDSFGDFRGYTGGVVDDSEIRRRIPAALRRKLNRQAVFLLDAVQEAADDAGLHSSQKNFAITYGSAFGCSRNVHHFYTLLLTDGPRFVSPQAFNLSVANAPPALAAQVLGVDGQVWVFAGDEISFEVSLDWACRMISTGRTGRVMVCAAEEISDSVMAIHKALGMLACGKGGGFALGEGAVAMVLESADLARARGASVYGRIVGVDIFQDTSCGPQEYPREAKLLASAAVRLLDKNDFRGSDLAGIDCRNGFASWDRTVEKTLRCLTAGKDLAASPFRLKGRIGESGFAGGAALAARLLDSSTTGPILSLNGARGGSFSSVLIDRNNDG